MCFSAAASFGASAVLSIAGAAAMAGGQTKAQRLFGAIPIIFSLQQFGEGLLWLSVKNPDLNNWEPVFTHFYLVFALLFWPVYIPYTIWLLEKERRRKKILAVLLVIGSLAALSLLLVMFLYPVKVMAAHHHIHFNFALPQMAGDLTWLVSLLYFMATLIAPFVSGIKRMRWLGFVFLLSYVISVIFFNGFLVSVWCYFAAVLSLVIVWIMQGIRKESLVAKGHTVY